MNQIKFPTTNLLLKSVNTHMQHKMTKEAITITINLASKLSLKLVKEIWTIMEVRLCIVFKKIPLILKVGMIPYLNRDLNQVSSTKIMVKFQVLIIMVVAMLTNPMPLSKKHTKLHKLKTTSMNNNNSRLIMNMKVKNKKDLTHRQSGSTSLT